MGTKKRKAEVVKLEITTTGKRANRPALDAIQAAFDAMGCADRYHRTGDYIYHGPSGLYLTARGDHYEIHNEDVVASGAFRIVLAEYLLRTSRAEVSATIQAMERGE